MQLDPPARASSIRRRLSAAACLLLASGMPQRAQADPAPTWQIDASGLIYGEKTRTEIFEPTARFTRLYADGQSLTGQIGFDVITGASPSGAMPTGQVQTTTSASGRTVTSRAGEIPLSRFSDVREAFDFEWMKPIGALFKTTTGAHFSHERDYQSLGANAEFSLDLMHRLTTVTAGVGYNRDSVFPRGGTRAPFTDGSVILTTESNPKRVTTGMIGLSRILTRRWMIGVTASRSYENGYLTEPYKVLSVIDSTSGTPLSQLTENRPSTRTRSAVLTSSVYHLTDDVLYLSYRYYWDDWGVRSSTFDIKYRAELGDDMYVQPHVRLYAQTPANFFRFDLIDGAPLPEDASSDYRLGPLRTATIGATFGFQVGDYPGEFTVRAEYIRQWGDGHPSYAVGVQRQLDLFPGVNTVTLVVGYSVKF